MVKPIVGTAIHEFNIIAEPIPVPHHVPVCLDDVFLPNLRMPCCEATTSKKPLYSSTQKMEGAKKRKRSRSQKSKDGSNLKTSGGIINACSDKENIDVPQAKLCRRERKRQRTLGKKISTSNHAKISGNADVKDVPSGMTTIYAKRTHIEAEISCNNEETVVDEQAKRCVVIFSFYTMTD